MRTTPTLVTRALDVRHRRGRAGTWKSTTAEAAHAGRARTRDAGTHASSSVTPPEG